MVIDSSAVIAILFEEREAVRFAGLIERAPRPSISAASFLESGMVLIGKFGDVGRRDLTDFIEQGGVRIAPVSPQQARIALKAFERFGKGRHPAALNFGDCFSYALAKDLGQPLLFKGDDFSQTDIAAAA